MYLAGMLLFNILGYEQGILDECIVAAELGDPSYTVDSAVKDFVAIVLTAFSTYIQDYYARVVWPLKRRQRHRTIGDKAFLQVSSQRLQR